MSEFQKDSEDVSAGKVIILLKSEHKTFVGNLMSNFVR
jgi:hypothetical protein